MKARTRQEMAGTGSLPKAALRTAAPPPVAHSTRDARVTVASRKASPGSCGGRPSGWEACGGRGRGSYAEGGIDARGGRGGDAVRQAFDR